MFVMPVMFVWKCGVPESNLDSLFQCDKCFNVTLTFFRFLCALPSDGRNVLPGLHYCADIEFNVWKIDASFSSK